MNDPTPPSDVAPDAVSEPITCDTGAWSMPEPVILDALRQVIDPELHFNIVDLGLVYGVETAAGDATVTMTLTSPGCPYGPLIIHEVKETVKSLGAGSVNVNIVWDPPWGVDRMSEEIKLELGFDL
jgi:metal-sulfur cluster biosynthetic enzyme